MSNNQIDDYGENIGSETIEALKPTNKIQEMAKVAQVHIIKEAMVNVKPNHELQDVNPDAADRFLMEMF